MAITRNGINRVDHGVIQRATFEETVEILFDAAALAESNTLKGVSENILMGQACPFGTGVFDLMLDEQKLMETIETTNLVPGKGDEMEYDTGEDDEEDIYGHITPKYNGDGGATPGYDGQGGVTPTYESEGGITPNMQGLSLIHI